MHQCYPNHTKKNKYSLWKVIYQQGVSFEAFWARVGNEWNRNLTEFAHENWHTVSSTTPQVKEIFTWLMEFICSINWEGKTGREAVVVVGRKRGRVGPAAQVCALLMSADIDDLLWHHTDQNRLGSGFRLTKMKMGRVACKFDFHNSSQWL